MHFSVRVNGRQKKKYYENGTETRIESKCMSDIPSQAGFVENKAAYMLCYC